MLIIIDPINNTIKYPIMDWIEMFDLRKDGNFNCDDQHKKTFASK